MLSPAKRRRFLAIHRWVGLISGGILLIVAVTGLLLAIRPEVEAPPPLPALAQDGTPSPAPSYEMLREKAATVIPHGIRFKELRLHGPGRAVELRFEHGRHVFLDPRTGDLLGDGPSTLLTVLKVAERIHTSLTLGEPGKWIVLAATGALAFALLSGLLIWLPPRLAALGRACLPARRARGRALHFSWHRAIGIWALFPLFVVAATGLVMGIKPLSDALESGRLDDADIAALVASSPTGSPASLDAVAARAQTLFPDHRQLRIHLQETGRFWRIEAVPSDSSHEHARDRAWFAPDGSLIAIEAFGDRPAAARLRTLARPLHDGTLLGWPGRIVIALSGLACAVLTLTGFVLWKTRPASRRKAVQPAPFAISTHDQPRPAHPGP